MLYAVIEIAAFMVGATIVGFLLGRMTKRSSKPAAIKGNGLGELQTKVNELESERGALRNQLKDAKERVRQLAAETTSDERSEDFAEEKKQLEQALADAEAKADRLRATIAERDTRIAAISSGEDPPPHDPASGNVGYSSSAGTFAETKIVFSEEDEEG